MAAGISLATEAQTVRAVWEFSDIDNVEACSVTEDLLSASFTLGSNLSLKQTLTGSGADTDNGYTAVSYNPYFVTVIPTAKVTSPTEGHTLTFTVTPQSGHKFLPLTVAFDACKVGTDGGTVQVDVSDGTTTSTLGTADPLRNKIQEGNSTGYSHIELSVSGFNVEGGNAFTVTIYVMNVDGGNNKDMGFRNITIEGEMDTEIPSAGSLLSSLQFTGKVGQGDAETIDLLPYVADLENGQSLHYSTKLSAEPTDFSVQLNEEYASQGYTASVSYESRTLTVTITNGETAVLTFSVSFSVSVLPEKGEATPLKRGLMAVHTDSGNLVSWRARQADDRNLKFLLYRRTSSGSETALNSGDYITGKTNFLDTGRSASMLYRLEVVDTEGEVIEQDSCETWSNQTYYLPLTAGAPTDPTGNGATYTPNDASYCDMDGDGGYEIILKWYPSNAKDAASSGTTSDIFFDCYKLDGTQLWRIDMGQNFFASAHTVQFIAWDFDGDGYGEFMVKTAPGTIDGQGNYVIMDGDDPTANWKNENGKQVEGPEYITVFDGMTGAELATIPYHTTYADGEAYWGDSDQNRSERYLAAIAWLDGEDKNPSPIFARGYYKGAFVGAYDWDGTTLKERWVSRNTTKNEGLWGEGAHWIAVADCDGDGKQEIVYGAAALDDDGSLLYRTGLGHGDALHVGDFDPDNEGLEVYQAHEESPYGADLRDAATGTILWHPTASTDTGRAIAAHFNPESEGAYFQLSSEMTNLYDWEGNVINDNVSHGGGGSLNNRIYWDGLLSDCHYDKSVLERYNPTDNSFDRIQVNGTNYTIGTLNNDTKYNPCVMGDLLGDWREEIVTWTHDGDDYSLIINATSYESDYTVPHLMDDPGYRAQVIAQNVCYNQPPHLDYNLRESKKIVRQCQEFDTGVEGLGKYWDCLYTTYPLTIPEGINAWLVTGRKTTNGVDTLSTTKLKAGTVIAANSGILYNSPTAEVTFTPSSLTAYTMSNSIVSGSYCDTTLPAQSGTQGYYVFACGDRGPGFYLTDGATVEHGTGYISLRGTTSAPLAQSYVLGVAENPLADGIDAPCSEAAPAEAVYNLQGIRLTKAPEKGIFIQGGKKQAR
ncbi:MAG: rhamnogalacturonan lyase [Prevotellaceae bacterium]|nr:rhamnogalacturonan lyase [Prevotellaceae bacterium]